MPESKTFLFCIQSASYKLQFRFPYANFNLFMKCYDYIIAGAGCAGLSLAYHLTQTRLKDKSILIVDKSPKNKNDRTWCFWEQGGNSFEPIVYRQWPQVEFHGSNFSATLDLGNYRYKMIRGIDFYEFVQKELNNHPNIEWLYGTITDIKDTRNGAEISVDGEIYQADWVFNSLYAVGEQVKEKGYHYLLQHFKGWEIQTKKDFFDVKRATLMDFRIAQHGEARFFYVLPLDTRRALIEFTVFSGHLLQQNEYEQELRRYIRTFLKLDAYSILHVEFGVIPMNDHPFPQSCGKHIIYIGTAGGQTKASTGYTFSRIQQQVQQIVQTLLTTGQPFYKQHATSRFKLYDSMLLNIMEKNRYAIKDIFTLLFSKNNTSTILKFLDEQTSLGEELKIMSTTPYVPFLSALADVLVHKNKPFK